MIINQPQLPTGILAKFRQDHSQELSNVWRLVTQDDFYDAEAELTKFVCKGLKIELEVAIIKFPYLCQQGQLPILTIGGGVYQKGQIIKYLTNAFMNPADKQQFDSLFNVFDICNQMLQLQEYYMWRDPAMNYKYRDLYWFTNVLNKYSQLSYLRKINKQLKTKGLITKEQANNKTKECISTIKQFIPQVADTTFNNILMYVVLQSAMRNTIDSQMYYQLIPNHNIRDFIQNMKLKLSMEFELGQPVLNLQHMALSYNLVLQQQIAALNSKQQKTPISTVLVKVCAFGIVTYAIFQSQY